MGQTVADEGVQASGWVRSFSWILPGEMTKCSLPSLYINYQLLSRRHFVKEINETTSGQEQIRLPRREGGGGVQPGAPLSLLGLQSFSSWEAGSRMNGSSWEMCRGLFLKCAVGCLKDKKIDSHWYNLYLECIQTERKLCEIYFKTLFTQKLLLNVTNNYKEMTSNTELKM